MSNHRTLLLNSWYFPIQILRWEDAVKMIYEKTVDVVVEYDEIIRSPSVEWKKPAVVRLRRHIKNIKKGVKFSRLNVYTRDHYLCQYCGKKFPARALSYDHVVPRASGGKTVWENIVTSCKSCNSIKDNKSCDEAGMWPKNKPTRPDKLPLTTPIIHEDNIPEEWKDFIKDFS